MRSISPFLRDLRPPQWAGLILSIHLVLSLGFCFLVFPRLSEITSGLDPDNFGELGRAWFETGKFNSIQKAPLYPAFIALVSWVGAGYRIEAVQIAQCFLSSLSCIVFYAIFRRTLDGDEMLAGVAGLGCALFPLSIWYLPRLWAETLLTFTIALFTWSLVRLLQKPAPILAILCGLLVGAIALVKGIGLVFLPLSLLAVGIVLGRKALRWGLLIIAAWLLLIAPWMWRNARLTGAFVPIHTDGGYNFYLGNGFARHWIEAPFSYVGLKSRTEGDFLARYPDQNALPSDPARRDRIYLYAGLNELAEDPRQIASKLIIQSLTIWYLAADTAKSLATGLLQIPIVILALAGFVEAGRRRSWALILLVPVLGVVSVCVLVFAFARLSIPVMPYLIGMAIYKIWPVIKGD